MEPADRVAELTPHPRLGEAVAAMNAGDLERLRGLITSEPHLIHARTNLEPPFHYFMDLLLEHGAKLDLKSPVGVVPEWRRRSLLDLPLANHASRAAEKLIELGAKPDVCAAAALGRMDLLRAFFDAKGRLRSRPRRGGKRMTARNAIGLAMLFAYVNNTVTPWTSCSRRTATGT